MKKTILFVIPDLRIGGAEKSLLELCKNIKDKVNIHILTLRNHGQLKKEFEKNVHSIKQMTNNKASFVLNNRKYKRFLSSKKINEFYQKNYSDFEFDYIVSYLEGSCTHIVANIDTDVAKIAWIHTSLTQHDKVEDYSKFVYNVSVSNQVKSELDELNIHSSVIYNLIDTKTIDKQKSKKTKLDKNYYNVVSVARFDQAKALDRLIDASSEVYSQGIMHNLTILGSGRLYSKLKKQASSEHIKIINKPKYVYNYMKKADLFVLASKYEGYGMVVDEALYCKTNVLVTNTNSVESVGYGAYGQICDNSYEGIKSSLIKNIRNEVNNKFDKKDIKEQNKQVIKLVGALFEI